ncbi:hypothetical protein KCP71_09640 [Salmonella enterica subsp. enterica]|nr:hypothetical protein KCP71_09640 [Salmonella enterica subsp. enterica]
MDALSFPPAVVVEEGQFTGTMRPDASFAATKLRMKPDASCGALMPFHSRFVLIVEGVTNTLAYMPDLEDISAYPIRWSSYLHVDLLISRLQDEARSFFLHLLRYALRGRQILSP